MFGFVFNDWLYKALVFLVISCPCALVISIPLGYFGGIGAASRLGILFKGGNYLDAITRVNTVVFDKTGTLTKGVFEVESCRVVPGTSEEDLLRVVASIEKNSNHPIARAIVAYAQDKGIDLIVTKNIEEIAGYGLMTEIDGKRVLVGNTRLLSKYSIEFPKAVLSITETTVVCAVGDKYIGCIILSDVLKDDASDTVKTLKELNIKNIQILSGDKQSIVTIFANKLGITQAYGDLLPEGKVEHIERLKEEKGNQIAFVGDGMNDAPVLALSDVGIAMGGLGSDAAIETADVVIQTDQPSKVATAIKVGRCTRRIIWQNVLLAFGVKLLVLMDILKGHGFSVFDSAEYIGGICAEGAAHYTRKQLDALTEFVKRPQIGAKGMVYARVEEDGNVKSSVDKFYTQEVLQQVKEAFGAKPGDLILILSGDDTMKTRKQLCELRLEMGSQLGLRDKNTFACLWVVDFPMFEWSEQENRLMAMHHPFTHPKDEDIDLLDTDPAAVRADAYDMVINGVEVGGGSIRIHDPKLQAKMFEILGFTPEKAEEQFGFLMNAFKYGAPPHGGLAYGLDRWVSLFAGLDSIRDCIAFPKNNSGRDVMLDAPAALDPSQLDELNLIVDIKE